MFKDTPEQVLHSVTEYINTGNLDALLKLYEPDACFARIKRVIPTSNLALVISEWSFSGTGPDGKPINLAAIATDAYINNQMIHGVLS
jgi:hypothetical protein